MSSMTSLTDFWIFRLSHFLKKIKPVGRNPAALMMICKAKKNSYLCGLLFVADEIQNRTCFTVWEESWRKNKLEFRKMRVRVLPYKAARSLKWRNGQRPPGVTASPSSSSAVTAYNEIDWNSVNKWHNYSFFIVCWLNDGPSSFFSTLHSLLVCSVRIQLKFSLINHKNGVRAISAVEGT